MYGYQLWSFIESLPFLILLYIASSLISGFQIYSFYSNMKYKIIFLYSCKINYEFVIKS